MPERNCRKSVLLAGLLLGLYGPAVPPHASAKEASGPADISGFLETVNKRALEVASARKIRLAVIPLKGTDSARYSDKGFGVYLTERIASSMVSANSPIRLFERSLLENVLKEQALSSSGVFDKSEALKIGELAPIDYILTGTFTRLDQSIAVNLRFIDVVSGEVRGNISDSLELTGDLAALFEDIQALPPAALRQKDKASFCGPKWGPVKALMEDIGTPAKLDKLVDAAVSIPFAPPCGDIHDNVISLFARYKQYPPRYNLFLLQTLQKLENPDEDDRDSVIIRHLLVPGQLDGPAWEAALRAAGISKRFYRYLDSLLEDSLGTEASRKLLQERIGIILSRAEQKKLGRPVPLEPGSIFVRIMETLRSSRIGPSTAAKDLRPLISCYQAYGAKYAKEPGMELLKVLTDMYAAAGGRDRERVLDWVCVKINGTAPSRELAGVTVDLMNKLFEGRKAAWKTDASGGAPDGDLKRIASLCGKRVAETIPFIIGQDYRLDVTAFCLENGIKAPGIVPDLETLGRDLSGEADTARQEAVRLLKALGPGALPVEPEALKLLRRTDDRYLQYNLLSLLGAMRTGNPEAHRLMLISLLSSESYVADEAVLALAGVGEPAAAALKAGFPKIEEAYKQVRVLKVFQLRGKSAAPHLPWLKSVMDAAESPYVKNAAEDAIDAIMKKGSSGFAVRK